MNLVHLQHIWLVVWNIFFHNIWDNLPIDELIFFKMVIALHHQPDWIWARLRIPKHSDIVDLRNFDVSFDNSSIIGVKCSVNLGLTKKNQDQVSYTLIGGLEHEFYNILWLPIQLGMENHPDWLDSSMIFQRGRRTNHQPDI